MNGNEEIHSGAVCLHSFLIGCLIDVRRPCILYVDPVILKDLSYCKRKTQSVVLLLSPVIYGSRISFSSMSCIQHD